MPPSFSATVETVLPLQPAAAFAYIVPIDLPGIFTGYGPLPAVIGTRDQSGAWDGVGQSRTVLLSDGSSARERLTGYDPPRWFGYTVGDFSGSLRFLATSAEGEWWFTPAPGGATGIRWRYTFHARSWLGAPVLGLVAGLLWRRYMRKALDLAGARLQAPLR
jgi:hypothetical protein